MTENEAIKAIEHDLEWHSKELQPKYKEVLRYAIQALSEIQQYRAIGTIEEFKALKEKSVAKKVINLQINKMQSFCKDDFGIDIPCILNLFQFKCPNCNKKIASRFKNGECPNCGQKLDWQ